MTPSTEKMTQQSLETWRDLKFGMFIHFGVYSMLAGEWKGEKVKGLGEWIQRVKKIPSEEYVEVAKTFNPTEWDPDAIAGLAADAGMKYLVITSKHHDGFALFDSRASEYTICNSTYGKDLLKPLVEACRKRGILPGFYYSQDLDWHDPDGGLSSKETNRGNDFQAYLERKVKPQLTELLTQYGDIGVIWFDTPVTVTPEQSKELGDLVHTLQPKCIFNNRLGNGFGDFESLGDNQVPGGRCETFAETAGTLNDTWGYKNIDQDWKSPRDVIVQLCELASKGVNYLLNIGPDGLGRVPIETVDCLQKVGEWTRRCGVAIYETSASPFPLHFPWGGITTKENSLYLLVTQPETREITLGGIMSEPLSARLLGWEDAAKEEMISFSFKDNIVRIGINDNPEPYVTVIELLFNEQPKLDTRLGQLPDGSVILPAYLSRINLQNNDIVDLDVDSLPDDKKVEFESRKKLFGDKRPHPWSMQINSGGFIQNWKSNDNSIEWAFELDQPGEFEVWISSVSSKYVPWQGGHKVRVEFGDSSCEGQLVEKRAVKSPRSKYFPENACRLGTLNIEETGSVHLKLLALNICPDRVEGLAVTELQLVPVVLETS